MALEPDGATYTSSTLYHLVGRLRPEDHQRNFETLRLILRSMEIRTNSVGSHSGGMTISIDPSRGCRDGEPLAQTVTCFCDIPFEALGLHTSKYGLFGVGVDKRRVAEWGARPVIYIPVVSHNNPSLNNDFCPEGLRVWSGLSNYFPAPAAQTSRQIGVPPRDALESVHRASSFVSRDVLAFAKTFDVNLPESHPENYYMEREWRKFANLQLHAVIREIIAPRDYHALIQGEFPQLAAIPLRDPTVASA